MGLGLRLFAQLLPVAWPTSLRLRAHDQGSETSCCGRLRNATSRIVLARKTTVYTGLGFASSKRRSITVRQSISYNVIVCAIRKCNVNVSKMNPANSATMPSTTYKRTFPQVYTIGPNVRIITPPHRGVVVLEHILHTHTKIPIDSLDVADNTNLGNRSPPHGANANLTMVRDAGTTLLGSQHHIAMVPHHSYPSHVDVRLAYGKSLPAHSHLVSLSLIRPQNSNTSETAQVLCQNLVRMK